MDDVIRQIIDEKLQRYSDDVIRRIRRTSSAGWQTDEFPCKTLWDHWKLELQSEHSVFHELIEAEIDAIIGRFVNSLPHDEVALLTLADEAFAEEYPGAVDAARVEDVLRKAVDTAACIEPHRKEVQAMLDGQARDRYDRDAEGYGR